MQQSVFPWFQPIIEIATGQVLGYEALARQRDASGEIQSAGGVFSDPNLDRETRLELDRSVRRQALTALAQAPEGTCLSLNISPQWLSERTEEDPLVTLQMMEELGVDPSRVIIEITEHGGCIEQIRALAARYRSAGVRVALDDFGTGFQQLDRLLAFTPDLLKVDMRMFQNGAMGHQESALLHTLGDMASRLGCKLIFEGVETPEEFRLALQCNASYIQGYLFEPALAGFLPIDAKQAEVNQLLQGYLERMVEQSARRQWHLEGLHSQLLAMRELLLAHDGEGESALSQYCPDLAILRCFVCDREGHQVSPNYNYRDGQWLADSSVIGHNWSWRPWFYQLVAAEDYSRRILRSPPYMDISGGQRCFTLTLALDEDRVLVVDVVDQLGGDAGVSPQTSFHSDLMPDMS